MSSYPQRNLALSLCGSMICCSQGLGRLGICLIVFHHLLHAHQWLSIYYAPGPVLDIEKSNKVIVPELTDQWGWQVRKEAITTWEFCDRYGEPGAERRGVGGGGRLPEQEDGNELANAGGGDSRKEDGPVRKNGDIRKCGVYRIYIFNHTWCKGKKSITRKNIFSSS